LKGSTGHRSAARISAGIPITDIRQQTPANIDNQLNIILCSTILPPVQILQANISSILATDIHSVRVPTTNTDGLITNTDGLITNTDGLITSTDGLITSTDGFG